MINSLTALARPLRLRSKEGLEAGRKVTWLELFFDLVFVAAVSQVGQPLAADYTLAGLWRLSVLFVLIWWAWLGHTTYSTRFDTDDAVQRGLTLVQMFAAAAMAVNATDALGGRDSAGFAAAYSLLRLVLVVQFLRARRVAESRAFTTAQTMCIGSAAAIWLLSSVVPTPARFWLWGLALAVDLLAPLVTHRHLATVPPDGGHLPERFGLFTIILIGDSMVSVMRGMESQQDWSLDAALSAFLSMVVIFAIWWWYFDGAGAVEERALRSRAEVRRFQVWTYAHLPLYLAMLVAGVGLHHVVAIATFQRLHATEAWILCGALAVVMASVATLASAGAAHADSHRGTRARRQYGVAALMLALAGVGPFVPSSVLIGAAAVLFTLQAVVALRPTTAGARR